MQKATSVREVLLAGLGDSGFDSTVEHLPADALIRHCSNVRELPAAMSARPAAVVVIDAIDASLDEATLAIGQLREQWPSTGIVLIADADAQATIRDTYPRSVEYLSSPAAGFDIGDAVKRFLPPDAEEDNCPELIGVSPAMRELKALICRMAPMNCTVLITGETGTGKDVAAGLIHRLSHRSEKPLISVNCAALPEGLLESELFGYERGAFTGAVGSQPGQMRLANGGTLFLDEIGDLSASAQAKILRAIEQREVQPLGRGRPVPINIRIIAATHRNLQRLVDDGNFRSDLFFRLHVARLSLPTLRERPEDIPLLARHFLRELNALNGRSIEDVTPSAIRRLMSYHWPGNVRQLRNVIEAAALMCDSSRLSETHLRSLHCFRSDAEPLMRLTVRPIAGPAVKSESELLIQALNSTNWNVTRTAQLLSWSRMTVYRKVAKYNLERSLPQALTGT